MPGDGALFLVKSDSIWNHWYEVFITEGGQMNCDCMDRICRVKTPHLIDVITGANDHSCKHQRQVAKAIKETL